MSMATINHSAASTLALLQEPHAQIQALALEKINASLIDQYWMEISSAIPDIEALYEDESFPQRQLAALVVSKVFFHLEDLEDAMKYALGAGLLFDLASKTEYVQTIIAKCIDEYIALRVKQFESKYKAEHIIDPRLENIVERMFERCFLDGEYKQALGIALESRRLDKLRYAIEQSGDQLSMLQYCLSLSLSKVSHREFRQQVLRLIVDIYQQQSDPDYVAICQCLFFLDDANEVSAILNKLVQKDEESSLIAYQVAFDLNENQNQPFLLRIVQSLPQPASSSDPAIQLSDVDVRLKRVIDILSGDTPSDLYLQFLFSQNKTDPQIINGIKDKLEARNSVVNSACVMSHALMQCGTTNDTFLRENLDWLGRAINWAKFTAIASIGVIHKNHRKESRKLLGPYLPSIGSQGSPYSEGGALYALGLIHANHGGEQVDFLLESLRNSRDEIIQHGACLGLGLSAMATGRDDLFDELLKGVLYHNNAVAGEAAGLAMGLIMLGMGKQQPIQEMLQYAQDTKHEKIIRGIALGTAFCMYAREEEAEVLIEQLLRDKDPILRYGGVYTIALAYVGTAHNGAIRRLLNLAVSDVSDDVRRAAVTGLGFVMCNVPNQVPRVVSLLSESFNPYVRYGAAFAVGIACAGTGLPEALNLLFPLLKDRVDFVRQSALISLAFVLIQHNATQEPRVAELRKAISDIVENKHADTVTKTGAVLAAGILDAGGRNVTIGLRSTSGLKKMASIVGMAVFCQFWYWYPFSHFLSLALTPTTIIGLNKDMQMPKNWSFVSNAKPSLFAYPPPLEQKKETKVAKLPTATLSVTAKAKAKAKKKEEKKGDAMEIDDSKKSDDAMEVDKTVSNSKEDSVAPASSESSSAASVPEPTSEVLHNPARVTFSQQKLISLESDQRYVPMTKHLAGFVLLRDTQPDESEDLIRTVAPQTLAPGEEEEAPVPEPFQFTRL